MPSSSSLVELDNSAKIELEQSRALQKETTEIESARQAEIIAARERQVDEAFVGTPVTLSGHYMKLNIHLNTLDGTINKHWWQMDDGDYFDPWVEEVTDSDVTIERVREIEPFSDCFAILVRDSSGELHAGHLNIDEDWPEKYLGLTIEGVRDGNTVRVD